ARRIHERVCQGGVTAADVDQWREQIYVINDWVTPAARAFSDALGEGSRFILNLLIAVNLGTAVVLILLALLRVRRLIVQRRVFADALQLEKE
ncbi:PAS domain S-box protein, partial [Pseudomonas syringae pv. tagetis]